MATTTVRPETGAAIKPGPMVTSAPARSVQEDDLREFAAGTGLDGPFLADQLAAFIAHERMCVHLLRTLHARSDNPVLRSRYSDLESEALEVVDAWENLIRDLAGNPQYVSPASRAAEALDSKVIEALALSGSTEPLSFEQASVQAYLDVANQSVMNARLLTALAQAADQGDRRRAMETAAGTFTATATRHVDWALETLEKLTVQQAKHPLARKAGQVAEKVVGAVRSAVDRTL